MTDGDAATQAIARGLLPIDSMSLKLLIFLQNSFLNTLSITIYSGVVHNHTGLYCRT